ncbi:Ycf48-like protein precursor [Roseibium album]|nr:Ycf48-like protein precursor [Roseibium album]
MWPFRRRRRSSAHQTFLPRAYQDELALRLAIDLRGRAARLRWIGFGFVGAVVLTVIAACYVYFLIPGLEREAAFRNAESFQNLNDKISEQKQKVGEIDGKAIEEWSKITNQNNSLSIRSNKTFQQKFNALHFDTPDDGWLVGAGGMILWTEDKGNNWQSVLPITAENLVSVYFDGGGDKGWVVGANGTILFSKDRGKSWQFQDSKTTENLTALDFAEDGKNGWVVGLNGTLLRTQNGGEEWEKVDIESNSDLHSVRVLRNGARGWAVGTKGTILVSDGESRWTERKNGFLVDLESVRFNENGQSGWAVGDSGTILMSKESGFDWEILPNDISTDLVAIDFSADGQKGLLADNLGDLFITVDKGNTWIRQGRSAGAPVKSIQLDRSGELAFVLTEKTFAVYYLPLEVLPTSTTELKEMKLILNATNNKRKTLVGISMVDLVRLEETRNDALETISTLEEQLSSLSDGASNVFGDLKLSVTVTRVGLALLLLFLVSVFTSLYRYNLRMSAFYGSRADALILYWPEEPDLSFKELVDTFGPSGIEFGKAKLPSDRLVDLVKEAINVRPKA